MIASGWVAATATALVAIGDFEGGEGGVTATGGFSPFTSFGGNDAGGGGARRSDGEGVGLGLGTTVLILVRLMDRPVFGPSFAAFQRAAFGVVPQVDDQMEASKNPFGNSKLSCIIPCWKCPVGHYRSEDYSLKEYHFRVRPKSIWSQLVRKNRANHPRRSLQLGDLRLAWLVTFLAVVRLRNRSLAAKELGLTQGAVTKQLRSLEDWSGRVLIWSDSAPVRLTQQGEDFVRDAEETLGILTKFRAPPVVEQAEPPKAKISAKDLKPPTIAPKATV